MQHATEKGLKVALAIDSPALGDTIAAIPTLRKISEAHDNKQITVFTSKPFLFEGHPLVDVALPLDQIDREEYFVHRTFMPLVGKTHVLDGEPVEFRHSNMDIRQFHAVSLGFTLRESEMEMDLYIEGELDLPVEDFVIIHPTHTWPTRTWEQAKWQELVDRLNERGIPVVAIGRDSAEVGHFNTDKPVMPIDIKLGANLLNDDKNGIGELRWMMNHKARAVVTMDSGILHVAGTTDVNIIQLGSSIDNKLRAPYRHGSQDYKYQYVAGGCGIFCSSNQKYNIKAHGSIHGVPPQVRCLEDKPTFECHPTVDQVFEATIKLYDVEPTTEPPNDDTYKRPEDLDRVYITHCDEAYAPIANKMIETVRQFSKIPVVAYVINSDVQLPAADQTIRLDFDIRDGAQFIKSDGNSYIDRSSKKVFDIITKKPVIIKHALENLSKHIVYLDGDTIATHRIDDLFNYTNNIHPMMTQAGEEFMMMNGKGSPFLNQDGEDEIKDLSLTLEVPACELFGVDIENRNFYQAYVQTGYISAIKSNIPFINEWIEMCNHDEVINNNLHYAPYHEETLVNVLLWKYKYRDRMPLVYVNANSTQRIDDAYAVNFNGSDVMRHGQWFFTPGKLEDIKVFHGEKRPEVVNEMIQHIKTKYVPTEYRVEPFKEIENHSMNLDKKTLLYLAPHLSTGGMPQFLLARVQAMIAAGEYNVHVLEYCQFSDTFLVQRNQLTDILGKNFHTIAGLNAIDDAHRTRRMIELIDEINPDLIHIEECPESFDSFNKLTQDGIDYIYDQAKPWRVIETCHNIWFQGDNKLNNPDAYIFCTPYHEEFNFKNAKANSKWLATYPIVDLRPTAKAKLEAKHALGFDTEKIHVLNVGLWTAGKNQTEGVEIARALELSDPGKFHFHFVGNQASNFREYWEPAMANLPENVTVWHEQSNVADYMLAADAFMFNSTWECNPLALREAISYGLVTFSRNLEQYLDMFTPYIIPFTDILEENATILLESLTAQEKIVGDFVQPQGEFEKFTQAQLKAYSAILEQGISRGPEPTEAPEAKFRLEYQNLLKLHVTSLPPGKWRAEFLEAGESLVVYNDIKKGHWYAPNRKWHTEWQVVIWNGDELVETLNWTLEDKECLIQFDSSSLGDTLAWMGQMELFMEQHKPKKLLVRTHKNWLFDEHYYNSIGIELISDWEQTAEVQYNVGVYYDEEETWKRDEHKYDWRHVTLAKIAADRLGLDYREKRPRLAHQYYLDAPKAHKQIVIATQSTAQAKYWNHPTGWQDLVNHYNKEGYRCLHASKEGTELKGIEQLPEELESVARAIQEAEWFIGISSGLSWFAWALGANVVIISGFTDPYVEMKEAIYVNNHNVCHGCWGNHTFDRGDWNWCPAWKGTQRQFECTKTISAEDVLNKIAYETS